MRTPPAIIQSLWIGQSLSSLERLCIHSYLEHGFEFHLYAYNDIENVPSGMVLHNAEKILPAHRIFKYKNADSYAGFANLFRYKLLLERGNFWSDIDMVCLSPHVFQEEFVFVGHYTQQGAVIANNSFMKFPPNSQILEYIYEQANNRDPQLLKWGDTGPKLLDAAITKFDLRSFVKHPRVHSPINHWKHQEFIRERSPIGLFATMAKFRLGGTYAMHLWNERWRRNNLNKDGQYPYFSLYEYFKRRYLKEKLNGHGENS